jgi:hypothetical protein
MDVLPAQQEAHEIAGGDRFDLLAQAMQRVMVDAGEQPAFAPFIRRARREGSTQHEALVLQGEQGLFDAAGRQPKRLRQCGRRGWPRAPGAGPAAGPAGRLPGSSVDRRIPPGVVAKAPGGSIPGRHVAALAREAVPRGPACRPRVRLPEGALARVQ